jgi:hypothetical protein
VLAYAHMNFEEAHRFRPIISFPDEKTNHVKVTA